MKPLSIVIMLVFASAAQAGEKADGNATTVYSELLLVSGIWVQKFRSSGDFRPIAGYLVVLNLHHMGDVLCAYS